MICSVARYQTHTLDTTTASASVTAVLVVAQDLVEEALDRRLDRAERTETCLIHSDGRIYPRAVPVTTPPTGTVTEFHGRAILGAGADTSDPVTILEAEVAMPVATITYTGGYQTYEDGTTDTRVPVTIEREIALIAQALLSPVSLPGGATSVRVGDAAASYATPLEGLDVYSPGASKRLRRYRRAVR